MTKAHERPLSPHLQVYRPQITSVLSIAHRISGFGLAVGVALATWWLWSIVLGSASYEIFYKFCKSMPGQLMLFMWLWALVFHFLNGIRHLFWDAGKGFSMKSVTISGWCVVTASMALSYFYWAIRIY